MSGGHSLDLTGPAGDTSSRAHRLDPRAKLVGLVSVTLVAVSTPLDGWPVWIACALVLASYAALAKIPPAEIWRRARIVVPFVIVAAVFLPFARPGGETLEVGPLTLHEAGAAVMVSVIAKATIGTVSAVLLAATTPVPAMLRGLERMRAPRVMVLIASLMHRYLFLLVGQVSRTRAALLARGYRPRHALETGPIGRASIALFLRTHDRGERVQRAMVARGFDGRLPQLEPLAFAARDGAFIAAVLVALIPIRVLAGAA
jgi:cobalt/nickel transport system permease protein